jgi:hypothetical protein
LASLGRAMPCFLASIRYRCFNDFREQR